MSAETGGTDARSLEPNHRLTAEGTPLGARTGGYYNDQLSEGEVAALIANYKPHLPTTQWLKIADFVRACVTDVKVVGTGDHVRDHMKITSRLTLWATATASLELDRKEIFDPSTISRFVQLVRDASPQNPHKRTLSLLIAMSESLIGTKRTEFRPRVYGRTPADLYSSSDLGWILGWAAGQGAVQRKRAADALIGFCLGAGARNTEMAAARVRDVIVDTSGVSVSIGGPFARTVPVHAFLADYARAAVRGVDGDDYLILPGIANRSMLDLVHYARRNGAEAPMPRRLRGMWLVRTLDLLPPRSAAHFGGMAPLGSAAPYMEYLAAIDVEASTTILRGSEDRW
ncbi:hypothetical protein [Conyzicola sp.]|uniref:hypothetical protein n=1 Tax=Conyzicola sp. TaxID=1969404 RepID=UPI0039897B49